MLRTCSVGVAVEALHAAAQLVVALTLVQPAVAEPVQLVAAEAQLAVALLQALPPAAVLAVRARRAAAQLRLRV